MAIRVMSENRWSLVVAVGLAGCVEGFAEADEGHELATNVEEVAAA